MEEDVEEVVYKKGSDDFKKVVPTWLRLNGHQPLHLEENIGIVKTAGIYGNQLPVIEIVEIHLKKNIPKFVEDIEPKNIEMMKRTLIFPTLRKNPAMLKLWLDLFKNDPALTLITELIAQQKQFLSKLKQKKEFIESNHEELESWVPWVDRLLKEREAQEAQEVETREKAALEHRRQDLENELKKVNQALQQHK